MERWKSWQTSDALQFLQAPTSQDDKYSHGVLGVIAGSRQYPGAAILVCQAALHTGIGMVRFSGSSRLRSLVLKSAPEVVTQSGRVQAWAIGSGIDASILRRKRKRAIISALAENLPTLLDAGGLDFLHETRNFGHPRLITPHYRELSRALVSRGVDVSPDEIQSDPKSWAERASKEFGLAVLLKGHATVIASEALLIEMPPATPWLATAGSGDVLSGIIGALLATNSTRGRSLTQSDVAAIAATGSLLHAHAAERASRGGPISASEIIREIPRVVAHILN